MNHPFFFLLIGLLGGVFGGFFGIGGATLMIPALILLGYNQHLAQGTMVAALLPPVALLAVWKYYQHGYVNVNAAFWIACGFFFGGYIGAIGAVHAADAVLKRLFGFFLLIIAVRMIFGR